MSSECKSIKLTAIWEQLIEAEVRTHKNKFDRLLIKILHRNI